MTMPTYAVKGIILNENNELLILQRNPNTRSKDNWDLPGGLVENEDEISALEREILEELNLEVKVLDKTDKWKFYREKDDKWVNVQNYNCKIVRGNIKLSNEHISYRWIKTSSIREYEVKDSRLYKIIEKL